MKTVKEKINEAIVNHNIKRINKRNELVDLGLSVKWASCNLGADSPEEYGDYFAWGEVEPKKLFISDGYKFKALTKEGCRDFTKYNNKDNKVLLDKEDDAAYSILGPTYRIPTVEECKELVEKTYIKAEELNGVKGVKIISKKDDSKWIFMPYAGYIRKTLKEEGETTEIWTSNKEEDGKDVYSLYIDMSPNVNIQNNIFIFTSSKYIGHSIRPVENI